jgi:hypothetical protein
MRNNRLLKRIFPFIALLLLLPWPVAYATDVAGVTNKERVRIEIAQETVPNFTAYGRAIGSVPAGDLFYIDTTNDTADKVVILYLTNADGLINHYTFMNLKIGVYVDSNGEWEPANGSDGELIPETMLSMRNGQVSFLLPGFAKYKVSINGGAYYCTNPNDDDGGLSPQLYLEVN